MKAMILAAGRGERMRPLTDFTPKPLLQVGGQTLIERHLRALAQAGVHDVVINLSWLGSQLRERLGDGSRYGLTIQFSDEGDHVLETGGGIHNALPRLGSAPFWVVNGDILSDYRFDSAELADGDLGRLILVPNPPQHPNGDFALAGDRVLNSGNVMHTYSGIAVLRPELFVACEPGRFPLAPLLRKAAADGRLAGELCSGRWDDVGTPERLQQAQAAWSD